MVPGVQANLMAFIRHPADGVLVVGHLLSHQEKGGLDPPLGQAVQQGLRGLGPGAVVKGQCHGGRSADGKHQQKAQKQRRENFSHKTHLLRKRLGLTGGGKWGMI